jgi:aryl-alcohol dehydrogenase-like predicted oxidoreductase
MEYTFLGKTGVKISQLCFGTMSFGGDADEAVSTAMFRRCRDQGINFFDCADVYQAGRAEEILGQLIQDCREEVVIATKVYFPMSKDINAVGASRYHIRNALEASLKRLQTDRIDIYYVHRFDDFTPLEETLGVLDSMVAQGKILYLGASNFAAWQVAKALGISDTRGWARFSCIQPMYNLVKRQAEVEILPQAQAEGLGVFPYSPLGGGLLTGKYGSQKKPDSGRLVENMMYMTRYAAEWMYIAAEQFTKLAKQQGVSPATLGIAWVAAHPAVTAPIVGARSLDQLKDCIASTVYPLGTELYSEIASLTPEPPPATDRNEEKTAHNFGAR